MESWDFLAHLAAFLVGAALLLVGDAVDVRVLAAHVAVPCPAHEALPGAHTESAPKNPGFTRETARNGAERGWETLQGNNPGETFLGFHQLGSGSRLAAGT